MLYYTALDVVIYDTNIDNGEWIKEIQDEIKNIKSLDDPGERFYRTHDLIPISHDFETCRDLMKHCLVPLIIKPKKITTESEFLDLFIIPFLQNSFKCVGEGQKSTELQEVVGVKSLYNKLVNFLYS